MYLAPPLFSDLFVGCSTHPEETDGLNAVEELYGVMVQYLDIY